MNTSQTLDADSLCDRLLEMNALVAACLDRIACQPKADMFLDAQRRLLMILGERLDCLITDLEPPMPSPSGTSPCEHVRALGEQRCLHCGDQLPMTWPTAASPRAAVSPPAN